MSRQGQTWNELDRQPCGTLAAFQWHRRHGEPQCYACLQANARDQAERVGTAYQGPRIPDPRPVRNGLPGFKPYVYRGLGYDQIDGHPLRYGKGCRCDTCRELHRQRCAKVRAELAARPRDEVPHGLSGYLNWACRCETCTSANTEMHRQNRQEVAS